MRINKNLLAVITKVISNTNAYSALYGLDNLNSRAHSSLHTANTSTLYAARKHMYKLKLVYDPEPRTQTLKETVTYCASIDLYTNYRIECYQTSASELAFDSDRDRTLALLYLTQSTSFTPLVLN